MLKNFYWEKWMKRLRTRLLFCYCVVIAWEAIELFINLFAKQIIVHILLWAWVLSPGDIAVNKTQKFLSFGNWQTTIFSFYESLNLWRLLKLMWHLLYYISPNWIAIWWLNERRKKYQQLFWAVSPRMWISFIFLFPCPSLTVPLIP